MASRDRPSGSLPGLPGPVSITPAELWDLYYREELSYAGIAARLGCSRVYVGKLMKRFGILPRGPEAALKVAIKAGRRPGPEPLRYLS